MKKVTLTLFVLGMNLFLTNKALAQVAVAIPTFMIHIAPVANTSKIRILVSKDLKTKFSICLKNPQREVIYMDNIPKNRTQYRFDLDLRELPNGIYLIECYEGTKLGITKNILKEEPILAKTIVADRIVCLN